MTGVEVAALALGAGSLGYGVYSGQQGAKAQKKAIGEQRQAQADATSRAFQQEAENEMAVNKASRKKPDLGALLASAQAGSKLGAASTMLSGPQAVKTNTLLGA